MSDSDSNSTLSVISSDWKKFSVVILFAAALVGGAIMYVGGTGDTVETPGVNGDGQVNDGSSATETDTSSSSTTSESSVNESQLSINHQNTLASSSFTVLTTNTVKLPARNESFTSKTTAKVGKNSYEYTVSSNGKEFISRWGYSEKIGYMKILSKNGEANYLESNTQSPASRFSQATVVKRLLTSSEYTVTGETTYKGETVTVIKDTGVKSSDAAAAFLPGRKDYKITKFDVVMYVSQNNIVKYVDYTVEGETKKGNIGKFAGEITVKDVGDTSVRKPAWVSDAMKNAVSINESVTNNSVALTVNDGSSVPADTKVVVYTSEGRMTGTVPDKLTGGDTLYLSVENGNLKVSINTPIKSGSALSEGTQIRLTIDNRRVPLYHHYIVGDSDDT